MKSFIILLLVTVTGSTEVTAASQTCQANIYRARDWMKAGSVDSSFPPDRTSIYWSKYPRAGGNSLRGSLSRIRTWLPPAKMSRSPSLFGSSISP